MVINLTDNAFRDMPRNCNSLERLTLIGTRLLREHDLMRIIGNSPNLLSLSLLHITDITDSAIEHIARYCTKLESLEIFADRLDISDIGMMAIISRITNLRSLKVDLVCIMGDNISRCLFSDDSILLLARCAANLEVLELTGSSHVSGYAISQIVLNCRRLRHLVLRNCVNVTNLNFDKFYEQNTPFGREPSIEYRRSYFERKRESVTRAQSGENRHLKCIVDCNDDLERRPLHSHLHVISLDQTSVNNNSFVQIAKHCPDLLRLNVCKDEICDDAVEALVTNCQLLREMLIDGGNLTVSGLRAVAKFGSNLKVLKIRSWSGGSIEGMDDLISICKTKKTGRLRRFVKDVLHL